MTEYEDDPRAPEDADEAMRPLIEAGEGESEGFEVAEHDLIENAEYTSGEGIPELDQFDDEEEEEEPDSSVYGEADEEEKEDL